MERLLWDGISSAVPCHPIHFASGASWVCRRTHFALFRWAITQRSLCLALQRSRGLKISPQQCVIFCVISMGPPGMCICLQNHISMWKWQRDEFLCARERIHTVGFINRCPRFLTLLQPFVWWTQRQLCMKELSKIADADGRNHLCQVGIIVRSSSSFIVSLLCRTMKLGGGKKQYPKYVSSR